MPETLISVLGGAGVAGVWVLSYLSGFSFTRSHVSDLKDEMAVRERMWKSELDGKDAQIAELKTALSLANGRAEDERRRSDSATEAAQTANLLLAGIQKGMSRS